MKKNEAIPLINLKYPFAAKVSLKKIAHKSDVMGAREEIKSIEELKTAAESFLNKVSVSV